MSAKSHRNRRWIGRNKVSRVLRSERGRNEVGLLLPCLALRPGSGPAVDATELAAEVARLARVGRRDGFIE